MEPSLAKCIIEKINPNYFFPVLPPGKPRGGNGRRRLDDLQRKVAEYCNGTNDGKECGFKEKCLNMGMLTEEPGVWGGTTEIERMVMLRRIRNRMAA